MTPGGWSREDTRSYDTVTVISGPFPTMVIKEDNTKGFYRQVFDETMREVASESLAKNAQKKVPPHIATPWKREAKRKYK